METRTLQFLAHASDGRLVNCRAEAAFDAVIADSKQVRAGVVFWALKGERFDGHDFVAAAVEAGAVACVVAESNASSLPENLPFVIVSDTRAALGKLGARYRQDFSPTVIAVAGSNGKTSVKDTLRSVLGEAMETVASEASFNNEIGVPQTLLRIEQKHRAAVLELGTNHPGELAPLIRMAAPMFGVITSIGREHLEHFHDLAGVAREEGTLAELLPREGALYINGDSPEVASIIARAKCRVVTVGAGESCDWRVTPFAPEESGTRFQLSSPDRAWSGEWQISLLGRHHAFNAALAIAVGRDLGVGRAAVQRGLSMCKPAKMRMQIERIGGATILNDAYNANADSMRAALTTLAEFQTSGRRIAVLGDMGELGATAEAAHREVGALAGELGIDHVVAIGRQALWTADCARAAGARDASAFANFETAAAAIQQLVQAGDVVLVKASRAAKLERVVEALRKERACEPVGTALAA
jgi:UDP-N-acetylmuramoyl-tripeptide--D-alanyl-D-alanine ligase